MNTKLICGATAAAIAAMISGCGDVESSQHKTYAPKFSVISSQMTDAPVANGRFQLTAGHQPATFTIGWNLAEVGRHSSYTANLYLSRDNHVDRTDKAVSSIQCDNFDTKGCGYSAVFHCDYTAADAIHCLDNSRSHAPDLSEHLRATGQWPWQGHLILEFCQSGSQQCAYSPAFPISLNKSTANNATNLEPSTVQIAGTSDAQEAVMTVPKISVTGSAAKDGLLTLEPDTNHNRIDIGWTADIDQMSNSVNLVLSKDLEFSYDDQPVYNNYLNYNHENHLDCQFTPMNEFICGEDRSQKLSEYFSNSGGMPWEGFLLVHFMPNRESTTTTKYVVPLKLQY